VLHFGGAAAGVTVNSNNVWVGTGATRLQNDSAGPVTINVSPGAAPSGIDLDADFALSNLGANPNFVKAGAGVLRLTSLANTANISLVDGILRVDDVTSGPSGFGALGSGTISLSKDCILV